MTSTVIRQLESLSLKDSSPSPSLLDFDIIDLIIDEVAQFEEGRVTTLKSCALVCREWRAPAQRRLFSSFELSCEAGSPNPAIARLGRFSESVRNSNDLASYVREVKVIDNGNFYPYLLMRDHLPQAIRALRRLESFKLLLIPRIGPLKWTLLTPAMRSALVEVFTLPSLRRLSLHNVILPSISAELITSVSALGISTVKFHEYMDEGLEKQLSSVPRRPRSALQTLYLGANSKTDPRFTMDPFLDAISSTECRLQKLVVVDHFEQDVGTLNKIMHGATLSLTSFECRASSGHHIEPDTEPRISLREIENLRKIKLNISAGTAVARLRGKSKCHECTESRRWHADGILQFVSTLRAGNHVEEITVEVSPCHLWSLGHHSRNDCCWEQLDSLLSGTAFENLRKLTFSVIPCTMVSSAQYRWTQGRLIRLQKRLPRLRERGLLDIDEVLQLMD